MSKHVNHAFLKTSKILVSKVRNHAVFGNTTFTDFDIQYIEPDAGIRRACRMASARGKKAGIRPMAPLKVAWGTKGLAKCLRCEDALEVFKMEIEAVETLGTLQAWDAD